MEVGYEKRLSDLGQPVQQGENMKNMSSYLLKRLNCGFIEKLSVAAYGDVLTPLTELHLNCIRFRMIQ